MAAAVSCQKSSQDVNLKLPYHLVEKNMHVLRSQGLQEIFRPDPLAPVTTSTAAHAVRQPQRLVVVPVGAGRAAAVVTDSPAWLK